MATYFYSPIGNDQVIDDAGNPAVGWYWQVYLAGTTTPVTTYTSNTGPTAQPTNITLNASGRPANPIWLSASIPVKFRLFNASAVIQLTIDNISGIGDQTTPGGGGSTTEWILYATAPTYISATSFSVPGDQTGTFQVGRRVKTTNSGGTRYSTITASVYGALTTVTVVNDSGSLDSGISVVSYGIISSVNTSAPSTLARSGVNTDITSLASPAIASATATTQAALDSTTKVATTAFVTAADTAVSSALTTYINAQIAALSAQLIYTGQVIQIVTGTNAGVSTTSAAYITLMAGGTLISITPKSTTSKLLVQCNFFALIGSNNMQMKLYEATVPASIGNAPPYPLTGNYAMVTLSAELTNTALTARTFGLAGLAIDGVTAVQGIYQVWKITEIKT